MAKVTLNGQRENAFLISTEPAFYTLFTLFMLAIKQRNETATKTTNANAAK